MAMDKNDLIRLLNKVPKAKDVDLPTDSEMIQFLQAQIAERQKTVYRFVIQVETAKRAYATQDDKEANDLAEVKIREATGYMKSLLWELKALREILAEFQPEV